MKMPRLKKKDIKVVSNEEAFWTQIKDNLEAEIQGYEKALKYNRRVYEMALSEIKAAKSMRTRKLNRAYTRRSRR